MSVEDKLRLLILSRYKSMKAFCDDAGIIYTSFMTAMKSGLDNANAGLVLKIANALGIEVRELLDEKELEKYGIYGKTDTDYEKVNENINKKWVFDRIAKADDKQAAKFKKLLEFIENDIEKNSFN